MSTAILIVAVIFVTATNAAPLNKTCMEPLNSTGPYDYCNKTMNTSQGDDTVDDLIILLDYCNETTNTSQGDDALKNLIILADGVIDTIGVICNPKNGKNCPCEEFTVKEYDLGTDRDVQNDRINSQLEMLLEHQQQWNVTCDAEVVSRNSSFSDVCATIEMDLRILTQHMIDYLETEKCGCLSEKCHYLPGKEFSDDGDKKISLEEVFCKIVKTINCTHNLFKRIVKKRKDTESEN